MLQLWKHQQEALDKLSKQKTHYGLFMGVGTGKTVTALAFAQSRNYRRIMVIMPKHLPDAWYQGIIDTDSSIPVYDLTSGTVIERAKQLKRITSEEAEYFIFINYDVLSRTEIERVTSEITFDLVIADEAHNIGSHDSKRSMAASKLNAKFKLALTGTPYRDKPLDVFGIHRFLDPVSYKGKVASRLFGNWTRFKYEYATWRGDFDMILVDYKNLKNLAALADTFSYSVSREKALDLPPIQYITERVEMSDTDKKNYKKLEKECILVTEDDTIVADNVLTLLIRLQQFTGKSGNKLSRLYTLVDEIGNRPVVIFYRYNTDLFNIRNYLEHLDKPIFEINAEHHQLVQWRNSHNGVLLVQESAGSEGLDMTISNYVIFYSCEWSTGKYQQAVGRVHRPKQNNSVTVINIAAADTVDEDILQAIKDKETTIGKVVGYMRSRYEGHHSSADL